MLLHDFFDSAQFSTPEVDQVQPVLSMVKAEGFYDITFSIFASKTRFADVDSTKPPVEWTTEHSLIFSNAAISAQSEMSEQEQKTLIAKATTQANPEERTELRMGKYHQEVRKARMRGYVLDPTLPSISFSWRAETGAICTLTVERAAATRTARQEFLKYHRQILEKFSIICDDHFRTNLAAARDQRAYG